MISGINLKTAIKHKDLTVEKAAELLGISRVTLQGYFKHEQLNDYLILIVKEKLDIDLSKYEKKPAIDFNNLNLISVREMFQKQANVANDSGVPYGNKILTTQDMVDMVRKNEAIAKVTLIAVAEILAMVSKRQPSDVTEELQAAVNKLLKDA